ncbi:hypothetical protein STSP2_00389 [Anaerohalosphaera lusitana]|uniref:Preprotein translocase subunit SecB n=1 Tax=Anaerohalosphaera lusitana TaxID=1936003 RepID=A0A1U9NIA9_9BACT|nr:hypothetical protein [Anaerohalosphaera lusitana]AQT67246.1 hypothetical protein STSP2_00389 [Anaerohalosphaera lusitana]
MNSEAETRSHDVSLAAEASERVELVDVRLMQCSGELISFPEDGTNEFEVTGSTSEQLDTEENLIFVSVNLSLDAVKENGEDLAQICSEFLLVYRVEDWEGLSPEHFSAFADYNGVFNSWPYWRELVQNMAGRLQLPSLTLPTYRFGYLLPKERSIGKKAKDTASGPSTRKKVHKKKKSPKRKAKKKSAKKQA